MQKLTKIVATIGPACESEEQIKKAIELGVNVFRFNFKHNSVEWHNDMIERVNKVAKEMDVIIGTLIDLQGPEIRINMENDSIELKEGEVICLRENESEENIKGFYITHPQVITYLKDGQVLKAADGEFEFEVKREDKHCCLISKTTGTLKKRKTLNIPGADFPFPVLVERDFEGLKLAKRQEVDYVALSFVRTAEDIRVLREEMKKYEIPAQVVSKVETQKALGNLDEIVQASDGIMVARGDLGVELPMEEIPYHQKQMITKCIEHGKFVITATQMLQTMMSSVIPTRAEVSDVANAAYDLSDATMLSGETAEGKYPFKAIEVMTKTLLFNENKVITDTRLRFNVHFKDIEQLVSNAAYDMYLKMHKHSEPINGFIVFTLTGRTARILSGLRPHVPLYAFCPNQKVAESLTVNFGVYPLIADWLGEEHVEVTKEKVQQGFKLLEDKKFIKKGESFIVTHGDFWDISGGTSTIKYIKV